MSKSVATKKQIRKKRQICKTRYFRSHTADKYVRSNPPKNLEAVFSEMAELEALRLVDIEGLSQEEAGQQIGVYRGTVWGFVQKHKKEGCQKPSAKKGSPTLSLRARMVKRIIKQNRFGSD